jgi:hypothetical protein
MRNEFIFGRQGNFPHKELDKQDRLPMDFDYARYLSIMLGHTMAKVIEVGASTWFQLWILNVACYMLLLAFPPVGTTLPVSCLAWVALGYVEALCIYLFHCKVKIKVICVKKAFVEMEILVFYVLSSNDPKIEKNNK